MDQFDRVDSYFYGMKDPNPGCTLTCGFEVHALASGSDGNCTVLRCGGSTVMIDAGLSGKAIVDRLQKVNVDPRSIDALLLTHEHSDHVYGAGILSRRYGIPICANRSTLASSNIGEVDRTIIFQTLERFKVGEFNVLPLPISHNAAEPNAFYIEGEGRRFLLATDLGKVDDRMINLLGKVDIAMVEANHDLQMLIHGPYPPALKSEIRGDRGHLSNIDCARALWVTYDRERKVFLSHLSRNNNTPEVAIRTVARTLCCNEAEIDCLRTKDDIRTIVL